MKKKEGGDPSDEEASDEEAVVVPGLRPGTASGSAGSEADDWVHFHGSARKVRALGVTSKDVLEVALPNDDNSAWGARAIF